MLRIFPSQPFEESRRMSMSMEVKLKIPVLIMFLHMTSPSSSLTLPRLSRSAVRCCNVYVHGSQVKNTCSYHVFTHDFVLLVVNTSSPFPTLPRLSRSAVRCCNGLLYFFNVARRDLKFPTRLSEPLLNLIHERPGYYKFREFAWGYSTLCTLQHPCDAGVIILTDLSQASRRPSRCRQSGSGGLISLNLLYIFRTSLLDKVSRWP